jgi:hypothetical protein
VAPGGATAAGEFDAAAFGSVGGAGGSGALAAATALDGGSDNVMEDSVALVELPAAPAMTELSDEFQSTGGTTCTMLPQRGQFRMLPTTDSSLTLSRARQVVQCRVNGSTYGSREKGDGGKPNRRWSLFQYSAHGWKRVRTHRAFGRLFSSKSAPSGSLRRAAAARVVM